MRLPIALLLCLWSIGSAADTVSAELISDPFVESYEPEVSVSGNVVVGIMTAATAAAIASDRIAVNAPASVGGQRLCLKAASRDGIYTSQNVYVVPDGIAGSLHLPYRSKLTDVVGDYGEDEIALSATLGDCDSGATDYYVLGSMDDDSVHSAVMYLNSFGATDVFVEIDGEVEPCEYITEGRRTTFDFICTLDLGDGASVVPVTIIRERYGREQPPVTLRLIGAAAP